jgi:hypothetical protein
MIGLSTKMVETLTHPSSPPTPTKNNANIPTHRPDVIVVFVQRADIKRILKMLYDILVIAAAEDTPLRGTVRPGHRGGGGGGTAREHDAGGTY